MKLILSLISVLWYPMTFAATETCETSSIVLTLNADSNQKCKALDIEGSYQLKLCSNNQGVLAGEDSSLRFLFVNGPTWTARQDLIDFTNNVSQTEIFNINNPISKFTISKTKATKRGKIITQFNCSGEINPTSNTH